MSGLRKRVDDGQLPIDHLAMLQILGVERFASRPQCGSGDHRIVKRESVTFYDLDSAIVIFDGQRIAFGLPIESR